ncbi:uncharacterized protein LOC110435984 [Sorghum bicolor]|nr:uncharacterized protein LOC110435984 [Sorghum bicolor]|eukprot:XP_021317790.1 uncharacterized protein LOC110435984 [Sorghum bicolor]
MVCQSGGKLRRATLSRAAHVAGSQSRAREAIHEAATGTRAPPLTGTSAGCAAQPLDGGRRRMRRREGRYRQAAWAGGRRAARHSPATGLLRGSGACKYRPELADSAVVRPSPTLPGPGAGAGAGAGPTPSARVLPPPTPTPSRPHHTHAIHAHDAALLTHHAAEPEPDPLRFPPARGRDGEPPPNPMHSCPRTRREETPSSSRLLS